MINLRNFNELYICNKPQKIHLKVIEKEFFILFYFFLDVKGFFVVEQMKIIKIVIELANFHMLFKC